MCLNQIIIHVLSIELLKRLESVYISVSTGQMSKAERSVCLATSQSTNHIVMLSTEDQHQLLVRVALLRCISLDHLILPYSQNAPNHFSTVSRRCTAGRQHTDSL